jgi:hypothetical protein
LVVGVGIVQFAFGRSGGPFRSGTRGNLAVGVGIVQFAFGRSGGPFRSGTEVWLIGYWWTGVVRCNHYGFVLSFYDFFVF